MAASRFDVLEDPVYLWRVRSDGTSISQQRADPRDLADRILTKRWSTDLVAEHGVGADPGGVVPAGAADRHVGVLPRGARAAPTTYWTRLRDGVREFWGPDTVPFERTALPLRQRIMGWLVARTGATTSRSSWRTSTRTTGRCPGGRSTDREVVDHPFRDRPGLPPELLGP